MPCGIHLVLLFVSAQMGDSVLQQILAIKDAGSDDFAERFARAYLEHHKLLRGPEGAREIQPLFGWLLMEPHTVPDGGTAEAQPLLPKLGQAVARLNQQITNPRDMRTVIAAYENVQRYSQEVTLRMTVGAQMMAGLQADVVRKAITDLSSVITSGFLGTGTTALYTKLANKVTTAGLTDAESKRAYAVIGLLVEKVAAKQAPFVSLADFKAPEILTKAKATGDATKIESSVDGVHLSVEWDD